MCDLTGPPAVLPIRTYRIGAPTLVSASLPASWDKGSPESRIETKVINNSAVINSPKIRQPQRAVTGEV